MLMLENFSRQIRDSLRRKYRRIPSAAFVSIQFNRLVDEDKQVSAESVRRWMRGQTMPNQHHVQALVLWLSLDMNEMVGIGKSPEQLPATDRPLEYSADTLKIAQSIDRLSPEVQLKLMKLISTFGAS